MKKLFIAFILLFSFCSIVHAKEYIDTYHVDITVLDNGNISVTENIKVWAEQKDIKRGIYPVSYTHLTLPTMYTV